MARRQGRSRRQSHAQHTEHAQRALSPEWETLRAKLIHPGQIQYEEIRPIVTFGQEIKQRAGEVGFSPTTSFVEACRAVHPTRHS